jgi:hypothetical protein
MTDNLFSSIDLKVLANSIGTESYSKVLKGEVYKVLRKEFGIDESVNNDQIGRLLNMDRKLAIRKRQIVSELTLINNLPKIIFGDWLSKEQIIELQSEIEIKGNKLKQIKDKRDLASSQYRTEIEKLSAAEKEIYNECSGLYLIMRVTIEWVPLSEKTELAKINTKDEVVNEKGEKVSKFSVEARKVLEKYQKFLLGKLEGGKLPPNHNPFL